MMRTSLKKLRGFALNRHGEARDRRDPRLRQSLFQFDEITRASQDMQDMRDCYDSLLSAAAATANSAYEFSESLREMGACLLERTALNEDEESGKVLLMLGKLQFELQKIVDNYRSHIFQTITNPSESLLNELRTVEEMKRQCDEKRSLYEYMITRHKEKGRLRNSKEESFSSQQLQSVHDEYDDEATLFVFRLKSLKQGQSRSLLTQAARHHAAQLSFFRKALKSLEAVEPQVKLVTEQQHIDYQFTGLEDDDCDNGDSDDDDDNNDESEDNVYGYDIHDDGELSFDHRQNDLGQNVVSTPKCTVEEILDKYPRRDSFAFERELKVSSQSAPLSAEKKFDPAERFRQLRPLSSRNSYVLPTPVESKSSISTVSVTQISETRHASLVGGSLNYRHSSPLEQKKYKKSLNYRYSSPLEQKKYEKFFGNEKLSGPATLGKQLVLRESNNNATPTSLPPPLAEELSSQQHDQHAPKDKNKIRRYAFSGPLTGKSWSNKPGLSPSSRTISTGPPILFSGPLLRTPVPQPSSPPKKSPSASPPFVSSPKIRELHELPRPPTNLASKFATRTSNQSGYTVPLVSKDQENFAANKFVSSEASPLPTPPQTLPRSFSIPSRGQRWTILPGSTTRNLEHHKG